MVVAYFYIWVRLFLPTIMRAVLKFGGSVLRRGRDYLKLVEEVRKFLDAGWEVVVVVSAIKGVTDMLEQLARPCPAWREKIVELRELHERALHEVGLPSSLEKEVMGKMNSLLSELYRAVEAVNTLSETSPKVRDYVLSFGERLSVLIAWAAFMKFGVEAVCLTGREAGIVTDDKFGEATPLYDVSRVYVNETLGRFLKARVVPIVTGFIAGTIDGRITTLGRGGSDLTATLLAALLDADIVTLYTDVPGIMTGDPRYVKSPLVVPRLSYDEAIACARLGAKRLHPRTFEPIRKTRVKTIITAIGTEEKTEITRDKSSPPLKLVTQLERVNIVRARVSERKLADTLIELALGLSKMGVDNLPYIQYSEFDQQVSIIAREDVTSKTIQILRDLQEKNLTRDIEYIHSVSLVSVVGHGVQDLGNISPLLASIRGITVQTLLMFDCAVSLAVSSDRSIETLCRLHDELVKQWRDAYS